MPLAARQSQRKRGGLATEAQAQAEQQFTCPSPVSLASCGKHVLHSKCVVWKLWVILLLYGSDMCLKRVYRESLRESPAYRPTGLLLLFRTIGHLDSLLLVSGSYD